MKSSRRYVLNHHLYEYEKGLRKLILFTTLKENKKLVEERLDKIGIHYIIQNINDKGINVFFGDPACVQVVESFNCTNLKELSPAQDFILGTLLGYDQLVQCRRYLKNIHCDYDCERCNIVESRE